MTIYRQVDGYDKDTVSALLVHCEGNPQVIEEEYTSPWDGG